MPRNLAVLAGNGLSIAFNRELNLRSITEEVLRRIEASDGGDVAAAMKEIAERALPEGVKSAEDFEILVGAFGSETRNLGVLETLAQLTKPADGELLISIRRVADFARQVRDGAISHVLEVICERSYADHRSAQGMHNLVGAIVDKFDGEVRFGNLNYDTLLLAALLQMCKTDLADLGHGWKKVDISFSDGTKRSMPALREGSSDFPEGKRIRLLHLHGSLTYWADGLGKIYFKFDRELLDREGQWRAVREGLMSARPVVVLANHRDKVEHVSKYPFDLAYSEFLHGLKRADDWLIVGYSFRDSPVNSLLRGEFSERKPKPRVLVVTHGEDLQRHDVERAFGWAVEDGDSSTWLTINRGGANGIEKSPDWQALVERK